jgi:hypothetical protein
LQEDALGAGTFTLYFVANYQAMYDDNDPSLYELVSAPSCEFCADALAQHAEFVEDQRSTEGGAITSPLESVLGSLQADGTWLVQFPIDIAPLTTYDASGSVIETLPAEHYGVGVVLEHNGDFWTVAGVNHQEIQ